MYAIITDLDSQSKLKIEQIRSRTVKACGGDPVPLHWPLHLSWQGAESYDLAETEDRMRMIAKTVSPIVTRTAGVGVFTGPAPVLYLPVTRTPELTALNETLWETLTPLVKNNNDYFSPDRWVPHVTIVYGTPEVTEAIACMAGSLLTEPLNLEITLDHIYMGYFNENDYGVAFRFPLLGKLDEAQP